MRKKCTYLIIGAGPTGLGAAYRLKEFGIDDFVVLERNNHVGGLASSFVDDAGFTWDVGGHVHFSHYDYYDRALENVLPQHNWNSLERNSAVWMKNRLVPYPLQHNLHALPLKTALRCAADLVRTQPGIAPKNFEEWMHQNFGQSLTETFFIPYNRKIWAHEPALMSHNWNRERVATPKKAELLKNFILRTNATSWGPNRTFRFPKTGGTGSIWQRVAKHIGSERIAYNSPVTRVDTAAKEVFCADNSVYEYENILNTMPLNILSELITPKLNEQALSAARELIFSSSHIVGLGLRGQAPAHVANKSWMYFPEDTTPFYRATVFSNYSDAHTPTGEHWSLMTETSESPHKPVHIEALIEDTVHGALAAGLVLSADDIISTWKYKAKHGYPTPSLARDDALTVLFPALEERGVQSRGRFGGWKYEVSNQDHSFMQGVEWADRMHSGKPEVTLFYPERVNSTVQK